MTRKDYVAIASHLAEARAHLASRVTGDLLAPFDSAVVAVNAALAADYPRFDRTRFLAAVYGVKGGK
jgi:hypothetical protein